MGSLNRVILIGRAGNDPELKTLDNGNRVVNMSLATDESYIKKGTTEKVKQTEWHNLEIWGAQADVAAKYVKKGDQVSVEGSIRTSSYEKDGVTKYTTKIKVENIILLGTKD